MGGFAIAFAMIYGGFRVLETGATPGQFFSFLAAFMLAYEPAKRLARLNIDLNTALVGVRILFDILDAPPTERIDDDHPPLKLATARVEFADVQFSYRQGETVIRDLSFIAEPGKMTALVGPSGGGKSTILNLILRFYDVDSGAIVIDEQNIAARIAPLAARARSPMSARTCSCSTVRCARTSRSAGRRRAKRRSSPPPRPPTRTISS